MTSAHWPPGGCRPRSPYAGRVSSPAERYAAARRRAAAAGADRLHRRLPVRRSTRSSPRRARRWRTAAACWSARRPGPARPWSASSRCTWRWPQGRKCFYTTPIKALSNQKYNDLVDRYGAGRGRPAHRRQRDQRRRAGGGDDHRGAAQHALRRLRRRCDGLGYVVMDEVHYLADRFRGAVWEEVIIHLPASVHAGLAVGDGVQRRGVRRLAGHRARRDHGGRRASTGRCRCGSTCWSASGCSTCSTTPTAAQHARGAPGAAALHPRDGRAGWS